MLLRFFWILGFLLAYHLIEAQEAFIRSLETIFPDATIDTIKTDHHFSQEYVMMIDQPIDHKTLI